MSRLAIRLVVLVSFLVSVPLSADTLHDIFEKAKTQVKNQSWQEALTTLDRLDVESARPGNETVRQQLVAPIAFYRGVCEASLDQEAKAEVNFATFLQAEPGSTINKEAYSRKAVAAFEAAGKDAASHGSFSLLQRFEEFKAPPSMGEKPNEQWADGPAKWLMTAEETVAWGALTSAVERAEFVETFWQRRNSNPGSEGNPARTAFDRRVAFADTYFQVDEQRRGSMTDPGMVFVLLGPPNRTGRKPILGVEDTSISSGASVPGYWYMATRNSVHVDGFTSTDASSGFREVWRYRREALPKAVSINELEVAFVTKIGYGRFVLQRNPAALAALAAARARGQS